MPRRVTYRMPKPRLSITELSPALSSGPAPTEPPPRPAATGPLRMPGPAPGLGSRGGTSPAHGRDGDPSREAARRQEARDRDRASADRGRGQGVLAGIQRLPE